MKNLNYCEIEGIGMQKFNCQRCEEEITQEDHFTSGKIANFNDGLCSSCLHVAESIQVSRKKTDYPEMLIPDIPSDGWRIMNNLQDYQLLFDQVAVVYNCLKPPKVFPVAGYLQVGDMADSYGAWFIYIYPDRALELVSAYHQKQTEYVLSLGGK